MTEAIKPPAKYRIAAILAEDAYAILKNRIIIIIFDPDPNSHPHLPPRSNLKIRTQIIRNK